MTVNCKLAVTIGIGAILFAGSSRAADVPGTLPGDEALTCDQIYAQGMAESQKDQQERERKNQERGAQAKGTAALVTGAMLTGGLGGTGLAAQRSAESMADRQMADLATPQKTNPRLDRLKELWTQKHCVRKPG
jgi:hypothetical protein